MNQAKTPAQIRAILLGIIEKMANDPDRFVVHPQKDFTRNRICTMPNVICNLITAENHTLNRELFFFYSSLKMKIPTKSAFIQARSKLKPEAFQYLLNEFNKSFPFRKTFCGFHLISCDGTDSNIPALANDGDSFISFNSGNGGYYQNHLVACYDLLEKRYTDAVLQPRKKIKESLACCQLVDRNPVPGKCLFIMDRGFFSLNLLAHFQENNQFFLLRVKELSTKESPFKFLPLPDIDEFDFPVHFIVTRCARLFRENPVLYKSMYGNRTFDFIAPGDLHSQYHLNFRLVKLKLSDDSFEYLITNLPDSFAIPVLKDLYHLRWGIETSFRFLKYNIAMSFFHSIKRVFIHQEVFSRLILYNFCSLAVACLETPASSRSRYPCHINFSNAVFVFRYFLTIPISQTILYRYLCSNMVPVRPDRSFHRKLQSQVLKSLQHRT